MTLKPCSLTFSAISFGEASGFPFHVCAEWLGHRVRVQQEHYAKVRPEEFLKAAGVMATQNPTKHLPAPDAPCLSLKAENSMIQRGVALSSSSPKPLKAAKSVPGRISNSTQIPRNMHDSELDSAFHSAVTSADLHIADLLAIWPRLSVPDREQVVRMARLMAQVDAVGARQGAEG